jgi:chromate reductase, NAD(P)H dehydrogenase (quinone)
MPRTPDMAETRLLLVTGSTRRLSTNSAALHTAQELLNRYATRVYEGLDQLPSFNPDDDHGTPPSAVQALRFLIAEADAVIFCTPEYAGTLPGSFKNLLDWTVGGGEIYGKPAAWINVAAPGRGDGADAALRVVLGYVGATVLESSGLRVPVSHDSVGPDGLIGDPATRAALGEALANILAELETLPSEDA